MLQFSVTVVPVSSRLYWISDLAIQNGPVIFQEAMLPPEDRPSERALESVGAVTVLEAMVEQQRRRSSIPPAPPSLELCPEDDDAIVGE